MWETREEIEKLRKEREQELYRLQIERGFIRGYINEALRQPERAVELLTELLEMLQ